MTRRLSAALRQLDMLNSLAPDWDGKGSLAPTEAAVMAALNYVTGVARFLGGAWPSPNCDGGVTLVWDRPTRRLSVVFAPDGHLDCIVFRDEEEMAQFAWARQFAHAGAMVE